MRHTSSLAPHLIVKLGQLGVEDGAKDALELRVVGRGDVDGGKAGHDARGELVAATTRGRHARQQLHVLDVLQLTLLAVIPTGREAWA